jgi:hypothetical protein
MLPDPDPIHAARDRAPRRGAGGPPGNRVFCAPPKRRRSHLVARSRGHAGPRVTVFPGGPPAPRLGARLPPR